MDFGVERKTAAIKHAKSSRERPLKGLNCRAIDPEGARPADRQSGALIPLQGEWKMLQSQRFGARDPAKSRACATFACIGGAGVRPRRRVNAHGVTGSHVIAPIF